MIRSRQTLATALTAWAESYSARVGRINKGSKESCFAYEGDLFEALGCSTEEVKLPLDASKENIREHITKLIADSRASGVPDDGIAAMLTYWVSGLLGS